MPDAGIIDVYLLPGDCVVGDARHRLHTLLGSCISITLWQPQMRIGAMSHFLLSRRGKPGPAELSGRYGEEALELMLAQLQAHGVQGRDCQAKVFGGGAMFPALGQHGLQAVGRRNGEDAEKLLQKYGIPVVSRSLFGVGHRQIVFDVASGDVWVRQGEA